VTSISGDDVTPKLAASAFADRLFAIDFSPSTPGSGSGLGSGFGLGVDLSTGSDFGSGCGSGSGNISLIIGKDRQLGPRSLGLHPMPIHVVELATRMPSSSLLSFNIRQ